MRTGANLKLIFLSLQFIYTSKLIVNCLNTITTILMTFGSKKGLTFPLQLSYYNVKVLNHLEVLG